MTWLKSLTSLIISITLCWLLKRISLFVSLILNLGFVAKMSLILILCCSLNLACYENKKVTKEYEKMCTSSMPYIAVFNNEKGVQISAQMKRSMLQACHVQLCVFAIKKKWCTNSALMKRSMLQACHLGKEVCYKHATCK